jgi:hypothetical protein
MATHKGLMCLQCNRPLVEVVTRDQYDSSGNVIASLFVSAKCTGEPALATSGTSLANSGPHQTSSGQLVSIVDALRGISATPAHVGRALTPRHGSMSQIKPDRCRNASTDAKLIVRAILFAMPMGL